MIINLLSLLSLEYILFLNMLAIFLIYLRFFFKDWSVILTDYLVAIIALITLIENLIDLFQKQVVNQSNIGIIFFHFLLIYLIIRDIKDNKYKDILWREFAENQIEKWKKEAAKLSEKLASKAENDGDTNAAFSELIK